MEENISSDGEMDYDFSTLPAHIVSNILYQLPIEAFRNASQVCQSWYYASCDPQISNKMSLYFAEQPDCIIDMDIFVRPVIKLRFDYMNFNKFDYKKLLRHVGPKITELHINSCSRLRITQLFEMFIYLTDLKVLKIECGNRHFKPNNFFKHKRITKHKAEIMANLGRVQVLRVNTIDTYLKGVEILLNYCTNLKTLSWNEDRYHRRPDYFLYNILLNRNNNCTSERLENLIVHSIDLKQNSPFFELLSNWNRTNLRSIDIKYISDTYYDVMFKEFCKTYKSLERLTMDGCNDQQLADICKYMRDIKTLSLDNIITVTNFNHISNLNNLESLTLCRRQSYPITPADDSMVQIFHTELKNLTDLRLTNINSVLLETICVNLPYLKRLHLKFIETKECAPIFHHLTALKKIHLEFRNGSQINSKFIESDPDWNVTKLIELEDLYISTFLPGFTPDLISKLPKLKSKHHEYIYDIPDSAEAEEENNEAEEENNEAEEENNEAEEENNEADEEQNDNDEEEQDDEAEQPFDTLGVPPVEEPEEEENREYDVTDFEFYSIWFNDCDIPIKLDL